MKVDAEKLVFGSVRRLARFTCHALYGAILGVGMSMVTLSTATRADETTMREQLPSRKSVSAPAGFVGLCAKYDWLCSSGNTTAISHSDEMSLIRQINLRVNQRTVEISDQRQYGTKEYWALPTTRGGDCEDLALLKKKLLVQSGISPSRLLVATALDHRRRMHAVLVFRTAAGDYVLDNLNGRVRLWQSTGYSFIEMQDPQAPEKWTAVFVGGVFG